MISSIAICALNTLFCILSIVVTGNDAFKITNLEVPAIVKNGSDPIILDCDYDIDVTDPVGEGLIVKWYFKNSQVPVYQWIAGDNPQAGGILLGRLNLEYKPSTDPKKLHKAIQIVTPTTELTGEYKCLVTTFENEAISENKKMVVYVPESSMLLYAPRNEKTENKFSVVCEADGVFPEPNMTITTREKLGPTDDVNVNIETSNKDGLYDIKAVMELTERLDGSSLTFDCILRIPEANYTVHKSIIYYPVRTTTTTSTTTTTTTTSTPPSAPRSYRTTPRKVANRTTRTHYLDPDLFRGTGEYKEVEWIDGGLNVGSWNGSPTLLLFVAMLLSTRL